MAIQKRTTKTGTTRWVARYRDATGKEHSRSFNTQRAAKAYLQDQQRAVRRNEWIAPTNTTVRDLVRERRDAADNASTAASRRGLLTNLGELADLNIAAVKPAHIRAWLDALTTGRPWADDKPLATSTATTYAAILHGVFTTAVNDDLISRHPMRGVKLRKVEVAVERGDIPTMADVRALIRAAEGTGVGRAANPTLAAMVQVAAETGVRAGELCGLRVRNVNFLKGEINIVEQVHQRTGDFAPLKTAASRRVVPVGAATMEALEKQLRRCPRRPDETVFATSKGQPYTSGSLGAMFRRLAAAAGIECSFHALRHFYASVLIESGASVVMVQRVLGHATASMTLDIYSHLFPGACEQVRALAPSVRDSCGIWPDSGVNSDGVGAGSDGFDVV